MFCKLCSFVKALPRSAQTHLRQKGVKQNTWFDASMSWSPIAKQELEVLALTGVRGFWLDSAFCYMLCKPCHRMVQNSSAPLFPKRGVKLGAPMPQESLPSAQLLPGRNWSLKRGTGLKRVCYMACKLFSIANALPRLAQLNLSQKGVKQNLH
jgi:hypothetical protein